MATSPPHQRRLLLGSILFIAALAPLVACRKTPTIADATPPPLGASAETCSTADATAPVDAHREALPAADCRQLVDHAHGVLVRTREDDPGGCMRHADCALEIDWPCGPYPRSIGVTKSYAPTFKAARERLDESDCKTWREGSCATTTPYPIPTQMPYWPTCERGRCVASTTPPRP